MGLPSGSEVKASASNEGDRGSIPGSGRSPGEGNGNPLWYSCLDNLMDRGSWWATVHGVARVRHDLVINNHQYQKLQEVVKTGKEACSASVHGLQSRTQLSD